nr:MAG TPA_asm: hypothetical protein [Caudoviricetes sp.]
METTMYKGKIRKFHLQQYCEELRQEQRRIWDRYDEDLKNKKEDIAFFGYPGCIICADRSVRDFRDRDYFEVARISYSGEIEYNLDYQEVSEETRKRIERRAEKIKQEYRLKCKQC